MVFNEDKRLSTKASPQFQFALLHPRYWLTWFGFGVWILVSQLPHPVLMVLGRMNGVLLYNCLSRRRKITERNIELCFPNLSAPERRQFVKSHFDALGKSIFETGMGWFGSKNRIIKRSTYVGLEFLQETLQAGRGFILLAPHITTLEVLGSAICDVIDCIDQTYRPHNNPVYDLLQSRARARQSPNSNVLRARDLRSVVKALKEGRCISFMPDQDYGRKGSIFVPFFGIEAATVTTTSGLARMANVDVFPITCCRLPNNSGYQVRVYPPLTHFPSGNDGADAVKVNKAVEECIDFCREQYLWSHRRFKTRPEGERDLYGLPESRGKQRRRKQRQRQKLKQSL